MDKIAWGAKVSDSFLSRTKWIVDDLEIGDNTVDGLDKLMSCIAWESGRSFSPSIKSLAGSGATGLIQFMPDTAVKLGTTIGKLAAMSADDQLNYVWKYFAPYKGKLKTLGDLYMAILWPAGVGKPETYVLWDKDSKPTTFRQNAGLDINKDDRITKAEATAKVMGLLVEGMSAANSRAVQVGDPKDHNEEPAHPEGLLDLGDTANEAAQLAPVITETLHLPAPVSQDITKASAVVETADQVIHTQVEPNDTVTAIKQAASGWQGNLTGGVGILLALLLDPTFSMQLGRFTMALATGNGRWGALVAVVGAGLIAYKHKPAA